MVLFICVILAFVIIFILQSDFTDEDVEALFPISAKKARRNNEKYKEKENRLKISYINRLIREASKDYVYHISVYGFMRDKEKEKLIKRGFKIINEDYGYVISWRKEGDK